MAVVCNAHRARHTHRDPVALGPRVAIPLLRRGRDLARSEAARTEASPVEVLAVNELSDRLDAARDRLQASEPTAGYLTLDEVAGLARCNEKTVRPAVAAGDLLAFQPAQRFLFREQDVHEWIESRPARSQPATPRPRPARRRAAPRSAQSPRQLARN